MRDQRGCTERTVAVQRFYLEHLLKFLRSRGRSPRGLRLIDIDALLLERQSHWSVRTRADLCMAVRGFLRFLHVTGRLKVDLSSAVLAPRVRRESSPPRALPWPDVQRILGRIERTTPVGRRDYALLLMMSVYWYGAGADLHARLPWLSAYMGHDDLLGTEVYLHATPALLRTASRRFANRLRRSSATDELSSARR
jgi:site-specific recombinase XerD